MISVNRLQAVVNHVAQVAGVKPVPAVPYFDFDLNAAAVGPPEHIEVSLATLAALDEFQLQGVLAHELAHIEAYRKDEAKGGGTEDEADKWAIEHGFGPQLLSAQEKARELFGESCGEGVHRCNSERIELQKQWIAEVEARTRKATA